MHETIPFLSLRPGLGNRNPCSFDDYNNSCLGNLSMSGCFLPDKQPPFQEYPYTVFLLCRDNQVGQVTNTSIPSSFTPFAVFLLIQSQPFSPNPTHPASLLQLFCNNRKTPKQINTSALSVHLGLLHRMQICQQQCQ